jgi:hypothetical protein
MKHGTHVRHVGLDQGLAGRSGDGDPVVAIGDEVRAAHPVDLDRRDRRAAPLGQGQQLVIT